MAIDRFRDPWLHAVAQGVDWVGTNEFHHVVARLLGGPTRLLAGDADAGFGSYYCAEAGHSKRGPPRE
jgi:hypothetical protein